MLYNSLISLWFCCHCWIFVDAPGCASVSVAMLVITLRIRTYAQCMGTCSFAELQQLHDKSLRNIVIGWITNKWWT